MLVEEEYKLCRGLIVENIQIIEKTEVYAVGAAAATMAFCATQSGRLLVSLACWLPLIISLLGAVRFWGVDVTIGRINDYLERMEVAHPELGWTTFYRLSRPRALKSSRLIFWAILIGVSLIFAAVTVTHGPYAKASSAPCARDQPGSSART